ncbi:MAG TPA: zf-HC2 domain-containing protein [bacterium]|nr:zf-HC2 domain-containing protein [bacterium]
MRPECQQCQEWMEEAFGGELKPELAAALDSHLAGCAECRANWEEFRLLRRGLDALVAEEDGPSPFVEAKILRAAAARNAAPAARPSGFWRWLLNPAAVGFATLALIAGLGYLGREELLRHRRADDLTAPVSPPPPPAPKAAPAPTADSLDYTEPAPAKPLSQPAVEKPEAEGKAKIREEKAAAPIQGFQTPAATTAPPPPLEEKARALTAPAEAPALGGASDKAGSGTSIPEAERAGPPTLDQESRKKSAEPAKEIDQAPAKALQRSAPQPAAPVAPGSSAGAPAVKGDEGFKSNQAQSELSESSRFDQLLKSAKVKIQGQDYAGALDDLLAAQKIRDTKEVQDLILLCRSHLRGDG